MTAANESGLIIDALDNEKDVDGHYSEVSDHFDSCFRITSHFPEYFNGSSEVNDVNENGNIEEDINRDDDATLNSDLASNFHKETGLWSYKSVSNHKPQDWVSGGKKELKIEGGYMNQWNYAMWD